MMQLLITPWGELYSALGITRISIRASTYISVHEHIEREIPEMKSLYKSNASSSPSLYRILVTVVYF